MIKKDIIEIANEVWEIDSFPSPAVLKLIKFAELVAAHEREECAKWADLVAREIDNTHNTASYIASGIRARGEK